MKPTRRVELPGPGAVYARRFACGGARLLTLQTFGDKHAMFAWDTRTWSHVWASEIAPSTTFVVAHDQRAVVTRDPQSVRLWRMDTGAWMVGFATDLDVRAALPDGRLLALRDVPLHKADGTKVDEGTRAVIFDANLGSLEAHFGLGAKVAGVTMDADATRMLAWEPEGEPRGYALWDVPRRVRLARLEGAGHGVVFRPGSDELVLAGSWADGSLPVVFDASSGARRAVLDPPQETVAECFAAACSDDGRWLATAHGDQPDNHWFRDQRVFLWDLERRACHRAIEIDWQGWPDALAFVEGRLLAVGGDRELAIWEIELG